MSGSGESVRVQGVAPPTESCVTCLPTSSMQLHKEYLSRLTDKTSSSDLRGQAKEVGTKHGKVWPPKTLKRNPGKERLILVGLPLPVPLDRQAPTSLFVQYRRCQLRK